MSKAFTRESDDLPEQPLVRRPATLPGGKHYLTPGGAKRLREELERLRELAGARAASPQEGKREAQPTAARMAELEQCLASAEVVPPPARPWEQVSFGATVTVRDATGVESKYRIVGPEETDLDQNWVSSTSPIARALLKGRLGQQVRFRIPAGEQVWEIAGIDYD